MEHNPSHKPAKREWAVSVEHESETRIAGDKCMYVQISCEAGSADCLFDIENRWYDIGNMALSVRWEGAGQQLLRAALEDAQKLKASVVVASIVSRESLEAMRQVFGDDSITVTEEGDFCQADGNRALGSRPTIAKLHHKLQ